MADQRNDQAANYVHFKAKADPTSGYLWPVVEEVLGSDGLDGCRVIDVGCGTGATTDLMRRLGFDVVGVEPSPKGVDIARRAFPETTFAVGNAFDDLHLDMGTFGMVTSFEVIEHLYDPLRFLQKLYDLTQPGGHVLLSTPYHGYWKNLSLAVLGKWDRHLSPEHVGGHIKFFSDPQLRKMLEKAGFQWVRTWRVGRPIPSLAKSMVVLAVRSRSSHGTDVKH